MEEGGRGRDWIHDTGGTSLSKILAQRLFPLIDCRTLETSAQRYEIQ